MLKSIHLLPKNQYVALGWIMLSCIWLAVPLQAQTSGKQPHFVFYLQQDHEQRSAREYKLGEKMRFAPGVQDVEVSFRLLTLQQAGADNHQQLIAAPQNESGVHEVVYQQGFCICIDIKVNNEAQNWVVLNPTLELSNSQNPYQYLELTKVLLNQQSLKLDQIADNGALLERITLRNLLPGRNTLSIFGRFREPDKS